MLARLSWLVAALAILSALSVALAWHARAIARVGSDGVRAGRAEVRAEVDAEIARQAAAAETLRAQARRQIDEMARRHASLEEALHALTDDAALDRAPARECLSADLVRKLGALGRGAARPPAAP